MLIRWSQRRKSDSTWCSVHLALVNPAKYWRSANWFSLMATAPIATISWLHWINGDNLNQNRKWLKKILSICVILPTARRLMSINVQGDEIVVNLLFISKKFNWISTEIEKETDVVYLHATHGARTRTNNRRPISPLSMLLIGMTQSERQMISAIRVDITTAMPLKCWTCLPLLHMKSTSLERKFNSI